LDVVKPVCLLPSPLAAKTRRNPPRSRPEQGYGVYERPP
jgi:hypothetical protein